VHSDFQKALYYSGDNIEKNGLGAAHSIYGERRGVQRILVGKPDENKPLGRPTPRWEDNIKRDLQRVRWVMD
jgi:hypothetical protein